MTRAIACHQLGLLGGPLLHRDAWYQVDAADGVLNPQPTPEMFEQMAHFASTFCVREITEARAAQLEWPAGWSEDPEDEPKLDPSVPPTFEPGTIADPEGYAEAVDSGKITPIVDPAGLSWKELKAYAKDRGIKPKNKAQTLRDLAGLEDE